MRYLLLLLCLPNLAFAQSNPLPVLNNPENPLMDFNVLNEISLDWDGNGIPDTAALVEGKEYASADLLLFHTDRETGQPVLEAYLPAFAYYSELHPDQMPSLSAGENEELLVISYEEQGAVRWDFNTTVIYRGEYQIAGYDYKEWTIGEATPHLECRVNFLTGDGMVTRSGAARSFNVPAAPVMADQWGTEPPLPPEC